MNAPIPPRPDLAANASAAAAGEIVQPADATADRVSLGPKTRPRVAIIANAPAPYRIAQHLRIVRELPQIEIATIFTHELNNSAWSNPLPRAINPVVFGVGEQLVQRNKGKNFLRQWPRGGEIIRWMKRHDVDMVILSGYSAVSSARIIHWCRAKRLPLFMFNDSNVFGDRARGPAKVFKKLYVSWVVKQLTGLAPCSRRGIEFFQRYGFPASGRPSFFMPHEPDYVAVATVTDGHVAAIRQKYGLRPDLKYINYCARMTRVKRPDLLVKAFEHIADQRPDWGVVFVGGGDLLDATKALVPDRLKDRVVFTGFVDGSANVVALYKACEIHVLPSDFEPWAAVVPEACAAGLAVIASEVVGAAAECIRDGVNGYTFKKGDANDLADKLLKVTATGETPRFRDGTRAVLHEWRQRCDPVDAVRRMAEFAGLLPPASGTRPVGDVAIDWKIDVQAGVNAFARLPQSGPTE